MWQQARTSLCVSQKPVADEAKPIKPWWNKGNKGRWQGIWCKLSVTWGIIKFMPLQKSLYCCSSIDVTLPVDCNLTFCMTKKNALTRKRTAQENTIPSFLSFRPTLFPNTWRQASPPPIQQVKDWGGEMTTGCTTSWKRGFTGTSNVTLSNCRFHFGKCT